MKEKFEKFSQLVESGQVEIYNEFSLQHELGLYLRSAIQDAKVKVQFERNVSFFFDSINSFRKKEIDISIFLTDKSRKLCAIELKYPRNGQYPEQMFSFCRDIHFLEQLKVAGFEKAYFIVFADEKPFYEGKADGIYGYFRSGRTLSGTIQKPTGSRDDFIEIGGSYSVCWSTVRGDLKFAIVEV
ncbi:hypothetical protein [Oryzomonas rubra]|uniref:Uncharacterized protein n=1 Tax=Oryzomonas rubra TaxID=2509454 RepID=A0A5A9XH66_9BACT|nr:hypothetical protein [Oryzomonas rubra]KAA0891409.1 hypothetical protein ET418_11560 [Oryzomonas rubra]